ncbi:hypothetical protein BBP40_004395 [Aspergillus hancockii]|nr:hypothetical protein BBP40_004395 [Aspergillus hancockii]
MCGLRTVQYLRASSRQQFIPGLGLSFDVIRRPHGCLQCTVANVWNLSWCNVT